MAKKRAKLTEVEQFYVENNPQGLSAQELATKFETTTTVVRGIQERAALTKEVPPAPVKEESMTKQMLIPDPNKQPLGVPKRKKGVVILTPGASERMDALAEFNRNRKKAKKYDNGHTAKSFPDEE